MNNFILHVMIDDICFLKIFNEMKFTELEVN